LTRFADYLALVRGDAKERAAMVVALTTNHTPFFRENHHFDDLRDRVLPVLPGRARAGHKLRIWSAGCSSGEEVYSIAMTLAGESGSSAAWL
ncbi:CheR family methyltransferase, partial [Acinetobacter baumannii]